MYKLGLKMWSTNTTEYLDEAKRLFEIGIFQYIELYAVKDTLNLLPRWVDLKRDVNIPFTIHAPHAAHGLNFAKKELEDSNLEIANQTKKFADSLDADYIIFHPGIDGPVEESARQFSSVNDSRILIENKVYKCLPEIGGDKGVGSTYNEITYLLNETGYGFCLDTNHAIVSANSQGINMWDFINDLNKLRPKMYHLSDMDDINRELDVHYNLGKGVVDLKRILSFIKNDNKITIETNRKSKYKLDDFEEEVLYLNDLSLKKAKEESNIG